MDEGDGNDGVANDGHLKGLEVVGDHPELLLQLHDLDLPDIRPVLRLLQVTLAN